MRSSITLIVALLALVGCAAAFQLWPIGWTGDREDREQTRHRRGVSDVASEEGWTRGLDEWCVFAAFRQRKRLTARFCPKARVGRP